MIDGREMGMTASIILKSDHIHSWKGSSEIKIAEENFFKIFA